VKTILILGANGLLGHQVYKVFKTHYCKVYGTLRRSMAEFCNLFDHEDMVYGINFNNYFWIETTIKKLKPDIVINCVGVTNHISSPASNMILVNSMMPNKISELCSEIGSMFVHVSTDCVFLGDKGNYKETDSADANDLYGRSKFLGEPKPNDEHLVLRTSFIGREIVSKRGLLEWFLSQTGEIKGFSEVYWSGLSSLEFARIMYEMIEMDVTGLFHVGGDRIDKYSLLNIMKNKFNKEVIIVKDDSVKCDRSLDSSKFKALDIALPTINEMIKEIANER